MTPEDSQLRAFGLKMNLWPFLCVFGIAFGQDFQGILDQVERSVDIFIELVKNDQKVSHNMILMSKYKGQHGGKKGKKNLGKALPPPFSGNARKKSIFVMGGVP